MAVILRLSQPNGVVRITSSKVNLSSAVVITVTDGFPDEKAVEEMDLTLVERRRSASARAALAT